METKIKGVSVSIISLAGFTYIQQYAHPWIQAVALGLVMVDLFCVYQAVQRNRWELKFQQEMQQHRREKHLHLLKGGKWDEKALFDDDDEKDESSAD